MKTGAIPENEADRLAALYELKILDTPAEADFDEACQFRKVKYTPACRSRLLTKINKTDTGGNS